MTTEGVVLRLGGKSAVTVEGTAITVDKLEPPKSYRPCSGFSCLSLRTITGTTVGRKNVYNTSNQVARFPLESKELIVGAPEESVRAYGGTAGFRESYPPAFPHRGDESAFTVLTNVSLYGIFGALSTTRSGK
jgi:hypothetical protein